MSEPILDGHRTTAKTQTGDEMEIAISCQDANRIIVALQEQVALLADPHAVHVNILRGILPLTKAQAIHIAGLPADTEAQVRLLRKALTGACHALRSYQYGNSSTDLAEEAANAIDAALAATDKERA